MNRFLEITRCILVSIAIGYGFSVPDPGSRFHVMALGIVTAIAGLTGIESLFFGKAASRASGYADGGPYQRQSGMNNLALALAMLISHFMAWGLYADAAVTTAFLLFLCMSGVNHLVAGFAAGGTRTLNTWLRPVGSAALIGLLLPVMLLALNRG